MQQLRCSGQQRYTGHKGSRTTDFGWALEAKNSQCTSTVFRNRKWDGGDYLGAVQNRVKLETLCMPGRCSSRGFIIREERRGLLLAWHRHWGWLLQGRPTWRAWDHGQRPGAEKALSARFRLDRNFLTQLLYNRVWKALISYRPSPSLD